MFVRAGDIWVFRGPDRLRVPAQARLFQTRAGLALVYEHAGRTEVRVYHALPSAPARAETELYAPARRTVQAMDLREEVAKRRTFAIISHPDAGKTTLTEKLLLYGGAIVTAGQVAARRRARAATSDWMELERERGISITSTVLQFPYDGHTINLLDTPGHQDFGEDTYRTLFAADSAVMLIDAARGVEPQTKKLFAICRARRIPLFTFINKMDRRRAIRSSCSTSSRTCWASARIR